MSITILIADDAAFMRNMIKEVFSSDEFNIVGEATNGIEVVELYNELKPDITTMDIVMPYKSGIESVRDIIKTHKDAKIIMCSALGQESLVMEAIEAGAADFIVKPFKPDKVLEVVKKVVNLE